jgi:AAA+ superfamily predicted ATPase
VIKALAKSLDARERPVHLLYVKSFEPTQGKSEQYSIDVVFKQARESAPCLLVLEDLNGLVEPKIRSYFLIQVDGMESNHGILVVASANDLRRLDPAIAERPSRFDRKYEFKLPGKHRRIDYAKMWSKRVENVCDLNKEICEFIGGWTEGFSFAYLQEIFTGVMLAVLRGTGLEEAGAAQEDTTECQCDKSCTKCGMLHRTEGAAKGSTLSSVDIPTHLVDNAMVKHIAGHIAIVRQQVSEKDVPVASEESEAHENAQPSLKGRKCC